MQSANELKTLP